MKKSAAEENPFNLEDLVVKPGTTAKASPKTARQRGGSFIQITATQADRLSGASVVVSVFFHLMFRSFRAYHKPFVLPNDALEYAGIDRFAQIRALRNLAKLGLILMERDGPRKSPMITIIGTTKPALSWTELCDKNRTYSGQKPHIIASLCDKNRT